MCNCVLGRGHDSLSPTLGRTERPHAGERVELPKKSSTAEKTERELAYLDAAEAFFQPEQHLEGRSRVQAYSDAMFHLHQRYPETMMPRPSMPFRYSHCPRKTMMT